MKMKLPLLIALLASIYIEDGTFVSISDQVFSITPGTDEEVEIIKNLTSKDEIELCHPDSAHNIKMNSDVHLYMNISDLDFVKDLLHKNGIKYKVMVENAQELIEMQTNKESSGPRSFAGSFYEQYHPLEEIYSWINKISHEHPDMLEIILIGSSFEKRPLYVLKLTGRRNSPRRAMWIDCGIHSREWISPAFCIWFVQNAIDSYNKNPEITQMLDNMEIYVLPVMNADGYVYTWTTRRMWRKNRSRYEGNNCVGTDLNRNFDAGWCTKGASHDPCDNTYCGPYPESEPEVSAVAKFLREKKDSMKLYFTIHSYGQMLLFPYSYSYNQAPNHDELQNLANEATQKIRRYYRTRYSSGPGAPTIYLAPGGSDDWAYDLGIKYSFTIELRDTGRYGFLLPPQLIQPTCLEVLTAIKTITHHVIENTE
ncbi:carboxypeptidase B2-like [Acipenser ruthenus]|uniref:carboxypeptidase B2-like n=1 Tax=Acipenser ruthenus TaxID=7906 RepID=UPI00274193F4|nr:carboxypeptidase B2-like [Acipenser ruthenus]